MVRPVVRGFDWLRRGSIGTNSNGRALDMVLFLFRLQARVGEHPGEAVAVGGQEGRELGGAVAHRIDAEFLELGAHLGLLEHGGEGGLELLYDLDWRAFG